MSSPALLLLFPLLSVTFGYEPSPDSEVGYDYIVQVEPEMLDQLREGNAEAIESNLPPEVNPIRRIRVVVGRETLPKKLRAPVTRTTFRQDVDAAASPDVGLLAQTGPGFGRDATGFSGRRRSTAAPPATTVPPVESTRREIGRQLDSGFENAQAELTRARESLQESGQRALDNGRRLVEDLAAPPQPFQRETRPIDNLADRARREVNDASERLRDSFGRATEGLREAADRARFDAQGPAHSPAAAPEARNETTAPVRWSDQSTRPTPDRYAERSVLGRDGQPVAPELAQTEDLPRDYRDRGSRDRLPSDWGATRTQPVSNNSRTAPRTEPILRFPEEPRAAEPNPVREPRSNGIVTPMVGPSSDPGLVSVPARNESSHANDRQVHEDRSRFDEFDRRRSFAADRDARGGSFGVPPIEETRPVASGGAGSVNSDIWLDRQGQERSTVEATPPATPPQNSSTSAWWIATAVAIGSVVVNLWQWLNIVDIRNKYRVALRRTSPGFARSAAA